MANGFCPFAANKNIVPGANDPAIKPRVAILHVDAGNASSLYDYFKNRSGGIESHFHVKLDGTIEQYRSVFFQADANHHANDFAVSIETQGYGAGKWTDAQLAAIKRLLVWLRDEHGIPLRKCETWNGSGVGYHIQFGSPGYWTPVAKSCPGPERVEQFYDDLVPWMRGGGTDRLTRAERRQRRRDARLAKAILDTEESIGDDIKKARRAGRDRYVSRLQGIRGRLRNLRKKLSGKD